jgi:hypothetical protein
MMRMVFAGFLLIACCTLCAQDTIGTLKVKKAKLETGYIPGTWRMTILERYTGTGKNRYRNSSYEQGPFTLQLNEDQTFILTKRSGLEWKGKWQVTDTLTLVMSLNKKYRKDSKGECRAMEHKVWKIEEATPGRLKTEA